MLKYLLYFSFLIFRFSFAQAQTWEPVGGGVCGGDTIFNYPVSALCVYNKKLYVGGAFLSAGKLAANHIAAWDGLKWTEVGGGTDDFVESFCVYNKMLCVGGGFSKVGNISASSLAIWNDLNKWEPLGNGVSRGKFMDKVLYTVVPKIVDCAGTLFILANPSDGHSSSYKAIYKWEKGHELTLIKEDHEPAEPQLFIKNSQYQPKGQDSDVPRFKSFGADANTIACFGGKLCIAGMLVSRDRDHRYGVVFQWDNNKMTPLYSDTGEVGARPSCLYSFDSLLYVGGIFNHYPISGDSKWKYNERIPCGISKWNGKMWSSVGTWPNACEIYCMARYNNRLYIGGQFDSICGKPANNIACWDGNTWEPVGAGFLLNSKKKKAIVKSLCVYKGELYAAGQFDYSGDKHVRNVAKLSLGQNKTNISKKKK